MTRSKPPNQKKTRQTVRTTVAPQATLETPSSKVVEKRLSMWQTILHILKSDGLSAFFSGLGPALILVSNPILQFTVSTINLHRLCLFLLLM